MLLINIIEFLKDRGNYLYDNMTNFQILIHPIGSMVKSEKILILDLELETKR